MRKKKAQMMNKRSREKRERHPWKIVCTWKNTDEKIKSDQRWIKAARCGPKKCSSIPYSLTFTHTQTHSLFNLFYLCKLWCGILLASC